MCSLFIFAKHRVDVRPRGQGEFISTQQGSLYGGNDSGRKWLRAEGHYSTYAEGQYYCKTIYDECMLIVEEIKSPI